VRAALNVVCNRSLGSPPGTNADKGFKGLLAFCAAIGRITSPPVLTTHSAVRTWDQATSRGPAASLGEAQIDGPIDKVL
jgi:hypothetical protein